MKPKRVNGLSPGNVYLGQRNRLTALYDGPDRKQKIPRQQVRKGPAAGGFLLTESVSYSF